MHRPPPGQPRLEWEAQNQGAVALPERDTAVGIQIQETVNSLLTAMRNLLTTAERQYVFNESGSSSSEDESEHDDYENLPDLD